MKSKTSVSPDDITSVSRLVLRNLPFHQSWNYLQIQNYIPRSSRFTYFQLFELLRSDWFHVALQAPLQVTITILLIIWTLFILAWAGIYVAIDRQQPELACGLGAAGYPIQYYNAFGFSLMTCTTVGYGLPAGVNAFFENCPNVQIAIYFQMIWSMMFNAFLVAFFYSKLAQCDSRSVQVLFSNKAIISCIAPSNPGEDPQIRLQVRAYDYDSERPIIEAHVRMYVVTKDRPIPRQLRTFLPDDKLGGMVFLSIPFIVNHHIDLYSVLHPPRSIVIPEDSATTTNATKTTKVLPYMTTCNGLPAIRQLDSLTGNLGEIICPICGEAYASVERWVQHVKHYQMIEQQMKYPIVGTHQEITDDIFKYATTYLKPTTSISLIREHFYNNISEIIIVVEGIEPTSWGTFCAMQSYMFEDIVFHEHAAFQPCLDLTCDNTIDRKTVVTTTTTVDLECFHTILYRNS